MMYYAELADHDGPSTSFRRRLSIEKISRSSEMSLGLDDICDGKGSRDGSMFSMSALDENLEDMWEDLRKECPNAGESANNLPVAPAASPQGSSSSSLLAGRGNYHKPYPLDWACEDNERRRLVKFSNEEPDIIQIPKVSLEDYPLLYYGTSELQQFFDELQEEERTARRMGHTIR